MLRRRPNHSLNVIPAKDSAEAEAASRDPLNGWARMGEQ